jgi:hypothetical protein
VIQPGNHLWRVRLTSQPAVGLMARVRLEGLTSQPAVGLMAPYLTLLQGVMVVEGLMVLHDEGLRRIMVRMSSPSRLPPPVWHSIRISIMGRKSLAPRAGHGGPPAAAMLVRTR